MGKQLRRTRNIRSGLWGKSTKSGLLHRFEGFIDFPHRVARSSHAANALVYLENMD